MPDVQPTLKAVLRRMVDLGCTLAYVKVLAENDNAKNQPYMGHSFDVLHLLPHGELTTDGEGNRTRFKATLKLSWLDDGLQVAVAPHTKLILYPQYPEVRLSGFLRGCPTCPGKHMKARSEDNHLSVRRIMVFGVKESTEEVFAYLAVQGSPIHAELEKRLESFPESGVFREITQLLPTGQIDTKQQLLQKLGEIAHKEWIVSKRLDGAGNLKPCLSPNCGGYTLEAELGITPNGRADPDYLGWEVKQHGVERFDKLAESLQRPGRGRAITLMTPEPTGGVYTEDGVQQFIRRYGYADQTGRADRINFGGKYVIGKPYHLNNVRMELVGFTPSKDKFDGSGCIRLVRDDESTAAAEWKFADLLRHWTHKHAKAVYVPSMSKEKPERSYRYAEIVRLGEGTSFLRFLHAVQAGTVYYDPGIKLENASTAPKVKRRSQFRILSGDIPCLYDRMSVQAV